MTNNESLLTFAGSTTKCYATTNPYKIKVYVKKRYRTGKIAYESVLLDTPSVTHSLDIVQKYLIGQVINNPRIEMCTDVKKEEYLNYKDRELYQLKFLMGLEATTSQIKVIERVRNLRKVGNYYKDLKGYIYIFNRITTHAHQVFFDYIVLEPNVIKYTEKGYMNALRRNNTRLYNATKFEFITDDEFFNAIGQKKQIYVREEDARV